MANPEKELRRFIGRYAPEVRAVGEAALARLGKRIPGAVALVYDNYNALAVGFGPTERASDVVLSVALYPRWVSLFFMKGVGLPDPDRVLRGSGKVVRHVVLGNARDLDKPAIRALIEAALERSPKAIDPKARGRTVIKSVSARQRPRRPS
jgi:hypothetical protein